MLRRALFGLVAVVGLLAIGSGTALAEHRSWNGGHHHHHHGGFANQGYGGYANQGYGGFGAANYGYSPMVVARPMVAPGYGCNNGFGGYGSGYGNPGYGSGYGGYGSPYAGGMSNGSPGFGFYLGR